MGKARLVQVLSNKLRALVMKQYNEFQKKIVVNLIRRPGYYTPTQDSFKHHSPQKSSSKF